MAFSIKELETISGIRAHTIRIWEQRYNFLKPARTNTNIRTYSNDELKTLLTVALLNKYGYKISRIDNMPPEQRHHAVMQLQGAEAQNEYWVNELISCMVDLKVREFEAILNRSIRNAGLEEALTTLVFRFLEKVGILWQTGRINPAQEHIVTNIIRQKIISGIDALPLPAVSQPLFLLFLPEHEHHELGLLYVYYLLRKKGIAVIYLGADVPSNDTLFIVQHTQPRFVYMHLTSLPRPAKFERMVQQLASLHTVRILLSGSAVEKFTSTFPSQVHILKSLPEVISYIQHVPTEE